MASQAHMEFSELAPIRFGYGHRPDAAGGAAGPVTADAMLALLRGPDQAALAFPGPTTEDGLAVRAKYSELGKMRRKDPAAYEQVFANYRKTLGGMRRDVLRAVMARGVASDDMFRERLWAFWSDHFTTRVKRQPYALLQLSHAEALRPHLSGRFSTLLRAATLHPQMIYYLDQNQSVGPESPKAKRKPGKHFGLNENLARELMELHTLGVNASYTQTDVRELAELLTGLQVHTDGTYFQKQSAEPGAEHVLGREYGGGAPSLRDIHAVLDDLARHPDTAQHLARKLAVHFVADTPDPALVQAMAQAYLDHDTGLMPVYDVLLTHPAALQARFLKMRQPLEWMIAAQRAMGVGGDQVMGYGAKQMSRRFSGPLRRMGQDWRAPPGPDGWPEAPEAWVTPQGLAERINWAVSHPAALLGGERRLPDPVEFGAQVLGTRQSDALVAAIPRAESRREAVALVLASPEFMRR
ncbi:DUF1800 domain-containing protein [Rhodobacteraceae bacterium]|nr:DUF1800 domain-containing protein [Paracoccaceae bacterium]